MHSYNVLVPTHKSLPLKLIEKRLQIAVLLTSFNLINSGANANLANDLPN